MATYTDVASVQAECGSTLTSGAAVGLIATAEELIDSGLGAYDPDPNTGRKIDLTLVQPWQVDKLQAATTKLAGQLFRDPNLLNSRGRYGSVSGPDFSFANPYGSPISREVTAYLNASGLRKLGGDLTN